MITEQGIVPLSGFKGAREIRYDLEERVEQWKQEQPRVQSMDEWQHVTLPFGGIRIELGLDGGLMIWFDENYRFIFDPGRHATSNTGRLYNCVGIVPKAKTSTLPRGPSAPTMGQGD